MKYDKTWEGTTFLYRISGHHFTFGDFLDRAKKEGAEKINLIVNCNPVRAYPDGPVYTEMSINATYFHRGREREVNASRGSSNLQNYCPDEEIERVRDRILDEGLRVQTITMKCWGEVEKRIISPDS